MGHSELWWQAAFVSASSLLFVTIVLFALSTDWAKAASDNRQALGWWMTTDVGTTLLIVRTLQGALTAAASTAVSTSFTELHWSKMRDNKGLGLIDLLALSPTTGLSGTLRIILGKYSKPTARIWAIARTCLSFMPVLAGILLFARTSLITVFDTALVHEVTAGIGPFNASYVNQFVNSAELKDGSSSVVPYSYSAVVHNLIANSLFSTVAKPIRCQDSEGSLECASYILSGGLSLTAPWTPAGNPDHSLVKINDVASVQVEFQGRSGPKSFSQSDCTLFGRNDTYIAAELCLKVVGGSMRTGLFICDGIVNGKCVAKDPMPNMTTTMSFYRRRVTVLSARSNLTIMALSDLSSPEPISISTSDVVAYKAALSWLLDYAASNIPPSSSIIEVFWSNRHSLNDTASDGVLLQNFRSVLAFPLWLFNANNYGNTQLAGRILNPDLPPEFYAKAAVVAPLVKLQFNFSFLIVFIVLEVVVLVYLWGNILYLFLSRVSGTALTISSFPIVDFLLKVSLFTVSEAQTDELRVAENSQLLKAMTEARAKVTELPEETQELHGPGALPKSGVYDTLQMFTNAGKADIAQSIVGSSSR